MLFIGDTCSRAFPAVAAEDNMIKHNQICFTDDELNMCNQSNTVNGDHGG